MIDFLVDYYSIHGLGL